MFTFFYIIDNYSTEKIEGTNVNVNINKNNEVELGSRSKNLDNNEEQIKIAIKNQGREIALTLKQMMKEGY